MLRIHADAAPIDQSSENTSHTLEDRPEGRPRYSMSSWGPKELQSRLPIRYGDTTTD